MEISLTIKSSDGKNVTASIKITDSEKIKIFVKNLQRKKITLLVEPSETIFNIKEMIKDKHGFTMNQQRLIYAGEELEDGHTLAHYNINKNTTVFLMLRK